MLFAQGKCATVCPSGNGGRCQWATVTDCAAVDDVRVRMYAIRSTCPNTKMIECGCDDWITAKSIAHEWLIQPSIRFTSFLSFACCSIFLFVCIIVCCNILSGFASKICRPIIIFLSFSLILCIVRCGVLWCLWLCLACTYNTRTQPKQRKNHK